MLKRLFQILTLAAVVNLVYYYWPFGEPDALIPVRGSKWKWGFVDESGRVRIEPVWDEVFPFDEGGRASVKRDDLFGAIDREGSVRVPVKYQDRVQFDRYHATNLAWVRRQNHEGFVNREGVEVVPPEMNTAYPFSESGQARVRVGDYEGLVDKDGRFLLDIKWLSINEFGEQDVAAVKGSEGWVLKDLEGEMLGKTKVDFNHVSPFGAEGVALVFHNVSGRTYSFDGDEGDRVGWIGRTGELVIPLEWKYRSDFVDGLAAVERDGKCGWIDTQGEVVIPLEWDDAARFDEQGFARVKRGEKYGVINREGRVVVEPVWNELSEFNEDGYAMARNENRKWGIIDEMGNIVIEPNWTVLHLFDEKGHALVQGGGLCGLLNKDGEVIFMKRGTIIGEYDRNGLAMFSEQLSEKSTTGLFDNVFKHGWIDRSGKMVIEVPEGNWRVMGDHSWQGIYVLEGIQKMSKVKRWIASLRNFPYATEMVGDEWICRAFNSDGRMVWNSTSLRPDTKAWLFLCFALLVPWIDKWREWRKERQG